LNHVHNLVRLNIIRRTSIRMTPWALWLIVLLFLAAGCKREPAPVRPTSPAKPARAIHVLYFAGLAEGQMIREALPQFTAKTGIRVNFEELPYDAIRQREITSIQSKLGAFDVIFVDDIWMHEYAHAKYVIPLDSYIKRDRIDMSDFPASVRAAEAELDGTTWLMPQRADVQVLFYRTDLFADAANKTAFRKRYGRELAVPSTWEEYRDVAEFFTAAGNTAPLRYWGSGETLKRPHFAFEFFAMRYWSWTGKQFLENTTPTFSSPGGVEALNLIRALRPIAAPGSANAAHDETISAFGKGQLAMAPQWYAFYATLRDPKTSAVAANLGVTFVPGRRLPDGTVRRTPSIGGGSLGIPSDAKDQEAAWEFIKYVTSPSFMADGALRGLIMPRTSAFRNPEVLQRHPAVEVYLASLEKAWFRPRLTKYAEIESLIGRAVSRAYVGEVASAPALADADREVRAALANP
jgi:multiple sugar transport system substrate-binding protein